MQTAHDIREYTQDFIETKEALRTRLGALENELNHHLAQEYRVDVSKLAAYHKWLAAHQPFHWFTEFFGILKQGGFDVIIGNPPYVEYSKVRKTYSVQSALYQTYTCGNLYALVFEKCFALMKRNAYVGFVVPTSSISTRRMHPLQELLWDLGVIHSTFGFRPAKLFEGVAKTNIHLSIILASQAFRCSCKALHHVKWNAQFRPYLFATLPFYTQISPQTKKRFQRMPRLSHSMHLAILQKLSCKAPIRTNRGKQGNPVYYRSTGGLHYRVFTIFPTDSRKEASISFETETLRDVGLCVYASNLWNMFYYTFSNCLDVSRFEVDEFPVDLHDMPEALVAELLLLARRLDSDVRKHAQMRVRHYHNKGDISCYTIQMRKSKPIIDQIDRVLARHYGFTDEEVDFIINYDIKYRMGDALVENV